MLLAVSQVYDKHKIGQAAVKLEQEIGKCFQMHTQSLMWPSNDDYMHPYLKWLLF